MTIEEKIATYVMSAVQNGKKVKVKCANKNNGKIAYDAIYTYVSSSLDDAEVKKGKKGISYKDFTFKMKKVKQAKALVEAIGKLKADPTLYKEPVPETTTDVEVTTDMPVLEGTTTEGGSNKKKILVIGGVVAAVVVVLVVILMLRND